MIRIVPYLREKALSLSSFIVVSCGFFIDTLYQVQEFPFYFYFDMRLFFFFYGCTAWLAESYFPKGLYWEHEIVTTGSPGKSHDSFLKSEMGVEFCQMILLPHWEDLLFFPFILLSWWIAVIDYWVLNQSCIPGHKPHFVVILLYIVDLVCLYVKCFCICVFKWYSCVCSNLFL